VCCFHSGSLLQFYEGTSSGMSSNYPHFRNNPDKRLISPILMGLTFMFTFCRCCVPVLLDTCLYVSICQVLFPVHPSSDTPICKHSMSWRMPYSGRWCRAALIRNDVSEECVVSIIRVTRISELETTLAVDQCFRLALPKGQNTVGVFLPSSEDEKRSILWNAVLF
jgi:hypothetical protein